MGRRLITGAAALATTVAVCAATTHHAMARPHARADVADTGRSLTHPTDRELSTFLWQRPGDRYIVVLGARVGPRGQIPRILSDRLDVAAQLARTHPFNTVIVSGGDTWWLPISEAGFMNLELITRGVPPWQMINEKNSTSTAENAANTVAILNSRNADGALIVTNGFHMQRALGEFRTAAAQRGLTLEFRPAYA
ncbi:YdcF family protein [Gordonia sp. L191]|uniref:YdcF family protein n=1 Tax=Gordonia sp. L191 TaxID=2982699 RepID=UPI0024BFE83E|nr:YdcF family protein [Gordonia sp. L191]WHU47181.1 YdcF family protein [Gordonia sp. L191]